MKKIIAIHHYGLIGGGTLSCFDVLQALDKTKYSIKLFLPGGESKAKQLAREKNIMLLEDDLQVLTFGYYNGGRGVLKSTLKLFLHIKYIFKWKRLLVREKPELVILNSITQWPMIFLLKKLNIKTICFVRETMKGKSNSLINMLIRFILHFTDGVSFISKFDKKEWNLKKKIKVKVIPDKVSQEILDNKITQQFARRQLGLNEKKFYILFLGGVNKLKGTHLLLDAFNLIKNKDVELLLLGNLEEKLTKEYKIQNLRKQMYVKKIFDRIEKNKNIKKIGIQKNTELWYAASDLVIFPATEAHQARPLYEAGAFKKPIIIPKFLNYDEYIKKGITALTFNPNNSFDLSEKIDFLIKNRRKCKDIGEENYKLTLEHHNPEIVDEMINIFVEEIIEKKDI